MTIRYNLNSEGKTIANWSVQNRIKPPRQIVLIPKEILVRDKLRPYFRRAKVVSQTETTRGYNVQLEAVRMPD